ncbi:pollen receptor-like kinase 3 [Argentina anserina]|uniref:pollen receptor-like kinase 3 n=1 Tax=Argentina anserina TaxID=57926 RepID=UPI0021764357|nr:pollen receptor-like kinase 3 [Potentilla anserina]
MVAVRCRFLFLLLFFFTFSPYLSVSLSEQEALLKLKGSLTNTTALSNWVPIPGSTSPCNWTGVQCTKNGTVLHLMLLKMGLSGTINFEALTQLKDLQTINLADNNFSGKIPDFNVLGDLKNLFLSDNDFSGEIPNDYFSKMISLKKLYLYNNNFSGQLPESLTQLKNLANLQLQNNQFSGQIPESITQLDNLEDLQLQSNQLSGAIPDLKVKSFKTLNLSNNNFEGAIPDAMSGLPPSSFEGNEGLCGKPLDEPCGDDAPSPSPTAPANAPTTEQPKPPAGTPNKSPSAKDEMNKSYTIKIVVGVIAGVLVLMLLVVVIRRKRQRKEEQFSVLGKENMEDHVPQHHGEVVEVHVPSSNSRSIGSTTASTAPAAMSRSASRKKAGDSKKGSHSGKINNGGNSNDLLMVNDQRGTFGLPDLMKAAAEVLGNGGLGSAYKAVMNNGLSVVVKRMREMNRLGREGFEAEMRRFGRLRHTNILTPLAYHYRREEKLLISDYITKGSLLYVLHGDRGVSHSELTWATRLRIIQGVASGMEFLHTEFAAYDLPHGNLKSSNILLNDDYEPVLNDYALFPLMNPNNAAQAMFAFKTPEYIESQQISPKSDVYCLGIVILEILTGKFPSQYLSNGKGGIDVVQWVQSAMAEQREQELLDPEIESNAESVKQMLQLLKIGADCTESKPDQRPDMREAIRRILEVQA